MRSAGNACRLTGRFDDALADFNRAIELDPGLAWAIGSRGETYQAMGRYDEALADFNRAIELDPGRAWAIGSRGETYQAMEPLRRGAGRLQPRHRTRPRPSLDHRQPRQDLPADGPLRRGAGRLQPRHRARPRRAWFIGSRGETYRRWAALTRRWPTSAAPSSSTPTDACVIGEPRRNLPADGPLRRGTYRLQPRHRTRPRIRLGHRQPRRRPTRRWAATRRRWPTSTAPSNSTPKTAWTISSRGDTYQAMEPP